MGQDQERARREVDAVVAAGGGAVTRRGRNARRADVVAAARQAAAGGGSLAGVATDLGMSEAAVAQALGRAGERVLLSRLRPHGRARGRDAGAGVVAPARQVLGGMVGMGVARGGRWLPAPSGDGLEAWRAARARRAAAGRAYPPVLPEPEEAEGDAEEGVRVADAVLEELAAREHASARKAARR